jgi:hypothetical protein
LLQIELNYFPYEKIRSFFAEPRKSVWGFSFLYEPGSLQKYSFKSKQVQQELFFFILSFSFAFNLFFLLIPLSAEKYWKLMEAKNFFIAQRIRRRSSLPNQEEEKISFPKSLSVPDLKPFSERNFFDETIESGESLLKSKRALERLEKAAAERGEEKPVEPPRAAKVMAILELINSSPTSCGFFSL